MTREQAQEAFKKNLREFPSLLEQTDRAIDLYVALGMLKLDEPKSELSVDQRVARVIGEWKGTHEGMNGFLNRMEAVGLKIIKA